jgi:hypothetical protein
VTDVCVFMVLTETGRGHPNKGKLVLNRVLVQKVLHLPVTEDRSPYIARDTILQAGKSRVRFPKRSLDYFH